MDDVPLVEGEGGGVFMRSALSIQPQDGFAPDESERFDEARRLIDIAQQHIAKRERVEAA